MSEILPDQDCSFPDFTREYVNFKIATKQRRSSAITMYTGFASTAGWVTLPKQGYSIILPLTALESTIKNIFAIRDTKTRMFRPQFYPSST